jgi:hypothetical protein
MEGGKMTSTVSISIKYLVIANVSKRANIKGLIYTALAYDFIPIIVGVPNIDDFQIYLENQSILRMDSLEEMQSFLFERRIPLVGIEIMDQARSILEEPSPFMSSIALMPGNEGLVFSNRDIVLTIPTLF